jgi:hypothetical protein
VSQPPLGLPEVLAGSSSDASTSSVLFILADLLGPETALAAGLGLAQGHPSCGMTAATPRYAMRGAVLMDDVASARTCHVVAVVIWIGR